MKFLRLKTTDPYYNLAVEEYFFKNISDTVFILWQNEPSVVIGKNQNVNTELDFDFIREKNIHVVRRITGGGAVYHDLGNLNYSFITDSISNEINFKYFCLPIIEALSALDLDTRLSGRNDIEIDGKKISGNAQCTVNGRTLHHGTLLFDTDLDVLSKALHVDEEKIKAKAIKSTRARVTNIKPLVTLKTVEEFISHIENFVIKKFSPEIINPPEKYEIVDIIDRNSSAEWIFPSSKYLSSYVLIKKKKFDFGLIEAEIIMSKNIIEDLKIHGDFFGSVNIDQLENKIKGKSIDDISEIQNLNVSQYICGMNDDEFIVFLTEN